MVHMSSQGLSVRKISTGALAVMVSFALGGGVTVQAYAADGDLGTASPTDSVADVSDAATTFDVVAQSADDVQFTYEASGGEVYITGVASSTPGMSLVIPESIDGNAVVGIAEDAFRGNTDIVSVTLPSTLTQIESNAFYGCTSLVSVDFPDNLQSIGFAAFYGCSSLEEAALPKNLSGQLQGSIFQDCTSLKRVNIPSGVTAIGGWAFCGCTSLEEVYFNGVSSLVDIGRQAFSNCTSLSKIMLPQSFASISYDSFSGCTALKDVYFMGDPSQVTFINWGDAKFSAFFNCEGATFHAFGAYYKDNLKSYVEDESCSFSFQALDENWFVGEDGNTYLFSVSGGQAVIEGVYLTGSTDVVIPAKIGEWDVVEIGDECFKAMGDTVLAEKPMHPYTDITSVAIPEGVTLIGKNAFYACTSMRSVSIPQTVTTIQSGAFCYCTSLTSIELPENLQGALGDIMFWGCSSLEQVNIPEGITSIGRWVFYDCRKLTEVVIPAKVKSIDKESFEACTSLEKVVFAEGSQCTSISQQVFWNCPNLTSINLPEGLTFIGVEAFRNCTSLEEIVIPSTVTSMGISMFNGCANLDTVKFMGDVSYVDEKTFADCSSLSDVWFYGDVSSIGFHRTAFENVSDVTFHAYEDLADALKTYVSRNAEERGFAFAVISEADDPDDTEDPDDPNDTGDAEDPDDSDASGSGSGDTSTSAGSDDGAGSSGSASGVSGGEASSATTVLPATGDGSVSVVCASIAMAVCAAFACVASVLKRRGRGGHDVGARR